MSIINLRNILLVFISTTFLLFSCKKNNVVTEERSALPTVDPAALKQTTELIWVPTAIFPQVQPYEETGIGMVLYSRMFLLNTKASNGEVYLKAIEQAIKRNRLLKFYVEDNTGRILAVEYVTDEEWKKI